MAAPASGSRRQSQRSRKVSAGLVSPTTCFSWPSSSQTNNQSYLPLPSWFSYLSLPSLFSWPFLHTLPKQTTKQTIKETNKHTNKKQTHKQVLQDVPRNSQVLPEIPDTSRYTQMLQDTARCSKTNNQTNKETNKHTNKRQTTQRSAFETLVKDPETGRGPFEPPGCSE